ncbi:MULTISPECIES: sulfur carrier protein ThiS [unclassified Corynebacterium]|uniref:sulfur carrier protein ThiS n=1 Tax=unclassified Corynebacterium TaxID=2624378 RepID=UPI0008A642A7|nr:MULTISPECIES: sulfur carrier protein ThiS [unclassified Corynebacterium]MDK8791326.1 sulfur carrier protein ThiS [Corynebacterium sp. MSK039]OFO16225.1 thiamine biosynthesis protein ThiS [Corynebacterium sp. HMSC22B11]OFS16569.1 thiamine biosynthesis protein ThiS [Corynebacterium sp. HMSC27B11]
MNYTVNQEERQGKAGLTIADVVANETGEKDATGIAIALNQAVVPRSQWENRGVADGDEIDILVAVQGG